MAMQIQMRFISKFLTIKINVKINIKQSYRVLNATDNFVISWTHITKL